MRSDTGLPVAVQRGVGQPTTSLPSPRRPALRRITCTDAIRPEGLVGDVLLIGRGRDELLTAAGLADVLAAGSIDLRVDFLPDRIITDLKTDPVVPKLLELVAQPATAGFRRAVYEAAPQLSDDGSLVTALLEDVPNVTMLSRIVLMRGGAPRDLIGVTRVPPVGICAGIAPGTVLGDYATAGMLAPDPPDVPAPELGDAFGSLDLPPAAGPRFRRARLLTAGPGPAGSVALTSWFRDTVSDADGAEYVIHEYTVDAVVDSDTLRILRCAATPHVLPALACLVAVAGVQELVGMRLQDVHRRIRDDFNGVRTCTHLNEQLRALGDAHVVVRRYLGGPEAAAGR